MKLPCRWPLMFWLGVLAWLGGCAHLAPEPLLTQQIVDQAAVDRKIATQDVEPIRGAITLEEAIARALKYNLDRRTRMMEEALAVSQLDLSQYDMLPKVVAAAGYNGRSEHLTTRSEDSVTGKPSLANPSIASEKSHAVADLGLTWNLLDFGLSYYNAKQNADRVLVAAERRRKALHLLIQDVRTAFWRAAGAQKLRADVRAAIDLAEDALVDARKLESERVRAPLDSLRYQRQVLENVRLLESIDHDLATAKVELAYLINAPLVLDLKIAEPGDSLSRTLLEMPVQQMEDAAIQGNADLREQFYGARIARDEAQKVMLRLFPNLAFNANLRYDSDRYLVHHQWNEAGLQLSWNLLNLVSAPAQRKFADAGVALADQRRVATQMAIMAQVHVARLQYISAYQQFVRADSIFGVDERINKIIMAGERAQTQSKLDRVSSNTTTILSLLRRYQALALAHAAASKLQASMGSEPAVPSVSDATLQQLIEVAREFTRQVVGEAQTTSHAPVQDDRSDLAVAEPELPTRGRGDEAPGLVLRLDPVLAGWRRFENAVAARHVAGVME